MTVMDQLSSVLYCHGTNQSPSHLKPFSHPFGYFSLQVVNDTAPTAF
jgi:hypothetical protein